MLAALAKDPSLVPSPPIRQLTTSRNHSSRGPSTLFCSLWTHASIRAHTPHVHRIKNKSFLKKTHPFQMLDKNIICSGQRVYCTRVGETSGVTVTLWASPFRSSCSSFTRLLPVSCRRTVGCWHWPSSLRSMLPWRVSEVPRTSSKPR